MKEIISKELLSLVLGEDVDNLNIKENHWGVKENTLTYTFTPLDPNVPFNGSINLDTLGRLCKEWCNKQGYIVKTEMHYANSIVCGIRMYKPKPERSFIEPWKTTFKSELEAIIKATEWVQEQL